MNWPIFLSTFSFIFVAALPGRTTFVMLMMATRGRMLAIFLGSALAFACQSFISVMLGKVLALFPQAWVQAGAGILFLYFAFHFYKESRIKESLDVEVVPKKFSQAVKASFILVFAAEWGDVSQVAIASESARYAEPVTVLFSAVTALWLIAAGAVVIGSQLGKAVNPKRIQQFAALAFAVIGIYLIVDAVRTVL